MTETILRAGDRGVTSRPCKAEHRGQQIKVPAGTRVVAIMGGMGANWSVAAARDVVAITGDGFTAQHYHAWIRAEDVTPD